MNNEHKIKKIFLVVVVLFLLFLGTVLVKQNLAIEGAYLYNDFKVQPVSNGKITTYRVEFIHNGNPYYLNSRNPPNLVDNISVIGNVKDYVLSKEKIFVGINPFDPELRGLTALAGLSIDGFIESFFGIPVFSSFTEFDSKHPDIPVLTCDKTKDGLIILELANDTSVSLKNNCILVHGGNEIDIIRAVDRLNFELIGIIRPPK
ncbi:MAG: hypothetical protein AABW49_04145 [Nanoarchaeota archaeon]